MASSILPLNPRARCEPAQREDHREKTIKEMATVTWSDLESRDGVRFSFNCWPDDRQSASKCVVPLGALVTPLKPIAEVPVRVVENSAILRFVFHLFLFLFLSR